ncbi:Eco57I restriction-modification methylase domain-containing protein [Clostridium sp. DJ247]|uniref:Eco57I restriction-modification methylase domain-containing protein n=1 Tax=Clostridium sp. DJ247 TaxID=2726188 RepID=UPI00162810A2|nr:N-6 DNA methylase [Clostridium sp. DJ247]MBC2581174.1 N-6 DNA methylase [Clostridium sp. DJ247]
MYMDFLEKINELYNMILLPLDQMNKEIAINHYKNMLNIDSDCSFSDQYYKLCGLNKENGVVYTPEEISKFIVKNIISSEDIINNPYLKILDPACGCGNIIIPCLKYLKDIYLSNLNLINKKNSMSLNITDIDKHILDNNLYGFDIDETALKILKIDIFYITGYLNEHNFVKKDFLIDIIDEDFDFIIGNPPYIGHKTIDKSYSKILKDKYSDIYKDKGDISYCFFKSGIKKIKEKGKLSFITSRYFLEAQSGETLRKMLTDETEIYKIVDFYGIRPFKRVGVDPVIIFLLKGNSDENSIEVIKPLETKGKNKKNFYNSLFKGTGKEYKQFYISSKDLNRSGWRLIDEKERNIVKKIEKNSLYILGNICESYQGIITGCDKAFVVDSDIIAEYGIEKDIIKPWIKSSYIYKNKIEKDDKFIIYSNLINSEHEYPIAIKYISKYKERLLNRRECKNGIRRWYELQWGRVQNIFEEEKIIFPYKSNRNRFSLDKGSYFSADVYSLILSKQTELTYSYLLFLLNSKLYEFYFKTFAKKLGEDLFEYYPNNINKLCIPIIPEYNEETNEDYLYGFFGLTKEEIEIVESSVIDC